MYINQHSMINNGRPDTNDAPAWYPYFFNLATGNELVDALQRNRQHMLDLIGAVPFAAEDFRYAENKWTVKQVFIHFADEERYYAYKVFCYSRQANVELEVARPVMLIPEISMQRTAGLRISPMNC